MATQQTGQISSKDELSPEQKQSFHSVYRTQILPAGTVLWRFVSKQSDRRFGSYWMDSQTMRTIMETLHANNTFSERDKKENVKNSLAVLDRFSLINWRLKIKLRKAVTAYIGITGTQKNYEITNNDTPFTGPKNIERVTETRLGRLEQIVIPRFRGLSNQNEWADEELFVHI